MHSTSLDDHPNALFWFGTPACNVCNVLRPAVETMIQQEFPKLEFICIDIPKERETAANYNVFIAPAAIALFEGRETMRWVRGFGINEIREHLQRQYPLCFGS